MKFNPPKLAVPKSDDGDSLQLPPAASTIGLSKERSRLDAGTCCDGFDLLDRPDQLKAHFTIFAEISRGIKTTAHGPLDGTEPPMREPNRPPRQALRFSSIRAYSNRSATSSVALQVVFSSSCSSRSFVQLTSGDDQRREGRESGPTRRLAHRHVGPSFA